eukprot:1161339-Pelagomonas_calceolata.AAC.3
MFVSIHTHTRTALSPHTCRLAHSCACGWRCYGGAVCRAGPESRHHCCYPWCVVLKVFRAGLNPGMCAATPGAWCYKFSELALNPGMTAATPGAWYGRSGPEPRRVSEKGPGCSGTVPRLHPVFRLSKGRTSAAPSGGGDGAEPAGCGVCSMKLTAREDRTRTRIIGAGPADQMLQASKVSSQSCVITIAAIQGLCRTDGVRSRKARNREPGQLLKWD